MRNGVGVHRISLNKDHKIVDWFQIVQFTVLNMYKCPNHSAPFVYMIHHILHALLQCIFAIFDSSMSILQIYFIISLGISNIYSYHIRSKAD